MPGSPKTHSAKRNDLKSLLALLKAEGVQRFRDGELEVEFAPPAPTLVPLDKLIAGGKKNGKDEAPKSVYDQDELWDAVGGRPGLADEASA